MAVSASGARIGRQRPTFEQVKESSRTDGPQAAQLASAFFGEPLEWQRHVLDVMLARDSSDKYVHHSVGISVPRQNGKSWDVRARCFYGVVTDGEKILYTCQHGDTADEMFKALSAPFEDEDNEELHELLLAVRKTNGQQAIYLKNGGLIRFTTRTNSLARGKSYDVLIYDEAQELTKAQQAASLPTISASKKHNTQTIYIGTPPGSNAPGEVFKPMHDRVHDGKAPDMAWMEWAAPEVVDPHDREWWYETNPSLGVLIDETAIEGEADQFDQYDFARERLGWWSPTEAVVHAVPRGVWDATRIDAIGDRYGGLMTFGVKFHPDGGTYSVVGCKAAKGRKAFAVEHIATETTAGGTRALAEWLAARYSKAACVVIDGQNGASALCDNLADMRPPRGFVRRPTSRDVVAASQTFVDLLADRSVSHTPDGELDAGAYNATRRSIGGNGGWGFEGSITLEAAALALWGARTTTRDPARKQMLLV
jgi:hypothetical protein